MTMELEDVSRLKQDALDKVIFRMTPKEWMTEPGPWMLDRGDGALLHEVEGREYLDVFAVARQAVTVWGSNDHQEVTASESDREPSHR